MPKIIDYRNAKQVRGNLFDLEINTEEYGWIPTSIDMDNIESDMPHMVQISQWLIDNDNLIDYKTPEEIAAEELAIANGIIRADKKAEIDAECLTRINAHLPTIDTTKELEILRVYAPAFTLSASGQSAKDIYLYALTKINQAETAPIADVQAYDPTTDTNWP